MTEYVATTRPTPEEYRKAAEALRYADAILDDHNTAMTAAGRPTAMLHGFDLDYLAASFHGNAAHLDLANTDNAQRVPQN